MEEHLDEKAVRNFRKENLPGNKNPKYIEFMEEMSMEKVGQLESRIALQYLQRGIRFFIWGFPHSIE